MGHKIAIQLDCKDATASAAETDGHAVASPFRPSVLVVKVTELDQKTRRITFAEYPATNGDWNVVRGSLDFHRHAADVRFAGGVQH